MKKNWLYNKTFIVSGASSGIGKGITKTLIEKYDCKIIGIGRSEEKMNQLLQELGNKSVNFSYQLFDVSKKDDWLMLKNNLNGKVINGLINCAGYLPPFKNFTKTQSEEIEKVLKVNFMSVIYSCETFLTDLLAQKQSAIVNISSMAALTPIVGTAGYSASKGALKNFTESLQQDLKGKMYIGLIYPGFTRTDIFRMQTSKSESKLIKLFSTSCEKMVKKCIKGIRKRKKRMLYGADCKTMNLLYKFFPVKSISIFTSIMKTSNIEMFKDIFD